MKALRGNFVLISCLGISAAAAEPAPTAAVTAKRFPSFHASTDLAVQQAHAKLWRGHIDPHGIILDFIGEIPTAEDCALGKPNAIGWRSPLANGAMFTGLYLPAACERARRSGAAADRAEARWLAQGLLQCASVSKVRGFVARGIAANGSSHYPMGSDDQTHPWFYGFHAYLQSDLPSGDERRQIVAKMVEVADALEALGWKCPCDGAFTGEFRGHFKGHLFRDAVRYLHMLLVMYDVTRDDRWLARYRQASAERPAKSALTRTEICAVGYSHDREAIKGIDENSLWIYVGCQAAVASLAAMETDGSLRAQYQTGLAANVRNALPAVASHREFDNQDRKVFGSADWRAGYPNWVPQKTQADAENLVETGDKVKLGQRKSYESKLMRNPLAAANIVALGGGTAERAVVEDALRHYDYAKLNMSEFFFAECAYFALPGSGRNSRPANPQKNTLP
jgi:hypothetical protein